MDQITNSWGTNIHISQTTTFMENSPNQKPSLANGPSQSRCQKEIFELLLPVPPILTISRQCKRRQIFDRMQLLPLHVNRILNSLHLYKDKKAAIAWLYLRPYYMGVINISLRLDTSKLHNIPIPQSIGCMQSLYRYI